MNTRILTQHHSTSSYDNEHDNTTYGNAHIRSIKSQIFIIIISFLVLIFLSYILMTLPGHLNNWSEDLDHQYFWDLRFSRVFFCWIVGLGLSLSGQLFQTATKNPLGTPDLLGVHASGSLSAASLILLMPTLSYFSLGIYTFLIMVFIGLLYLILCRNITSKTRLVLIGLSIHMLCTGLLQLLFTIKSAQAQTAIAWLAGSFWGKSWKDFLHLPYLIIALYLYIFTRAKSINVLILSDEQVTALGEQVQKLKFELLFIGLITSSFILTASGPIHLLALVSPHIGQNIMGKDIRLSLPMSACMAILFLLLGDYLGRHLLYPLEIPVGPVVSLIIAPYFIFILLRNFKKQR